MQSSNSFEVKLDEMIAKIQECQQKIQISSCSACEQYIECVLRVEYVDAVYSSMSKGETGGFDFN